MTGANAKGIGCPECGGCLALAGSGGADAFTWECSECETSWPSAPTGRPARLAAYVGGYPGPFYRLHLDDMGTVTYWAKEQGESGLVTQWTATPQHLKNFWRTFDRLGAWNFEESYETQGVCDGTSWSLIAINRGRAVDSGGMNGYPDGDGPEPGTVFKRLLSALSRLADGRPFE